MPRDTAFKIYGIAVIATMLMLCVWIFLNNHFDGSVWNGMKLSKSALTVEYCEWNNTAAFFHQAMNTYSNLGYFFLGMIVIHISFYDRKNISANKNLLQQFPLLSFFFGCCLVYLSFGSAFFHASLTWIGQRADMNGTYSICIGLLGVGVYRAFIRNASPSFKKLYVVILLLIVIIFIELHLLISSVFLLPFLILLMIILTFINYYKNPDGFRMQFALLSLLLIISAFALRIIDVKKIACDPFSFYQGHALWHFLTGMSAFFLYWFYRSELSTNNL
ncbi:MAG: hypothetical protein JWN78_252 [Bacteroidota bacterium]|nr:hypothetical protein [Bacteroidota bacterium]